MSVHSFKHIIVLVEIPDFLCFSYLYLKYLEGLDIVFLHILPVGRSSHISLSGNLAHSGASCSLPPESVYISLYQPSPAYWLPSRRLGLNGNDKNYTTYREHGSQQTDSRTC